jgi:peptide/nickel transport system permease protein
MVRHYWAARPDSERLETRLPRIHLAAVVLAVALVASTLDPNWKALGSALTHMILPVTTLTLALVGVFVRLTRSNMIETLQEDFVAAGRARGVPERKLVYAHALRNTFIPILTLVGLQVAILFAGAVLTETTFSWPGMGLLLRDGIALRDYPSVQGGVTVFAIMIAVTTLLMDILYAFVDPRIRY